EQDRVISIRHIESPYNQEAEIILNNSDLAFGTSDFKGYKIVISYGMTTTTGDQYSAAAPMWITEPGMVYTSAPGVLTLKINCVGIPNLMEHDGASAVYEQAEDDTNTVKTLLTAIVGATLAPFTHTVAYTATFDSEDSLIDSFIPAEFFIIPELNYSRLSAIRQLMEFTRCVFRAEDDGEVHFFVPDTDGLPWEASTAYAVNDYVRPTAGATLNETFQCTTAGTSNSSEPSWPTGEGNTVLDPVGVGPLEWTAREHDYTYDFNEPGQHNIYAKAIQKRLLVPNKVTVSNSPDDTDSFSGTAEDTDHSDLTDMEFGAFFYAAAISDADCLSLAKAKLDKFQQRNQTGSGTAPLNCGQEVHDYIKMVDDRQSESSLGNIYTIERLVGGGQWSINLTMGDAAQGSIEGLDAIPPILIPETEMEIPRLSMEETLALEGFSDEPLGEPRVITQAMRDLAAQREESFRELQRTMERLGRESTFPQVLGEEDEF
ncbi:hypothetical protein LCGC14_1569730, partial [marine sediment metagenome]